MRRRTRGRLLPAPPAGSSGWDAITLSYSVDAPLTALLPRARLARYSALFSFLWRVRRCEAALGALWSAAQGTSGCVSACGHARLARLLHSAAIARMHMGHFVACLSAYLWLGVLAPAWARLEAAVGAAGDMDALCDAHAAYLRDLDARALWQEEAVVGGSGARADSPAQAAVEGALSAILRFAAVVARLLTASEPLALEAVAMGLRCDTEPAEVPAREVRAALASQLDTLVSAASTQVGEATAAFQARLDVALAAFEELEPRLEELGAFEALRRK